MPTAPTVSTSPSNTTAAPAMPQPARGSGFSRLNRHTKEELANAKLEANALASRKLNTHSPELQHLLEQYVDAFCANVTYINPATRERLDYPKNGMLSEIIRRTPVRVYDLPELKKRVNTAFVDTTNRMYFSDTFFRKIVAEQEAGADSVDFLLKHEAEHIRRVHLQRNMDYHPRLANQAQDIRINIDIICTTVADKMREAGKNPNDANAFEAALTSYYARMGATIRGGMGTSREDFDTYGKLSEEAICALLLKNWKDKVDKPDTEFSFIQLCEGVALDLDAIMKLTTDQTLKQHATQLASEIRKAGASKGKSKISELEAIVDGLTDVLTTTELTDLDIAHDALQKTGTVKVASVNTGDVYVDTLRPSKRIHHLQDILDQILNPVDDGPQMGAAGKIKIKDLELPSQKPSQPPPQPGSGAPNPSQSSSPSTGSGHSDDPASNIYEGDEHVMDAKELARILTDAGCHDAVAKLGYDDLAVIGAEQVASKNAVIAAINQATQDRMKVGSVYAGGHMTDYANAQINDFYKPVMSWKSAFKGMIDDVGRASRYDNDEPWMIYHADHEDMGMASANDIPYMGSFVPGAEKRPLVIAMVDDSGSVGDQMLVGFVSEAINMARESDHGDNSPEVIILFCDSTVRGEPAEITADNFEHFLKNGITAGGRGGTNFTASVQHAFKLFEPGNRFEGRTFDAMVYFTDTFDAPPNQSKMELAAEKAGFAQLPPMLFLAPKSCYSDKFKNAVAPYAETIFFDESEMATTVALS